MAEVVIEAGNTFGCTDLQTIEDNIYEEDELLRVTLFSTTDSHVTVNRSVAVVEITDNDGMCTPSLCICVE